MKKFLALIFVMVFLLITVHKAEAAQNQINVLVDDKNVNFTIPPIVENGRTLVEFRSIFEALDYEIFWDSKNSTITCNNASTTLKLKIGDKNVYINGNLLTLEVAPKVIKGRTVVPLRFVGEASGKRVDWYEKTRTITIDNSLVYNDGSVYIGQFKNNLPDGKGKIIYPGGKTFEGNFVNGVPQKQSKIDIIRNNIVNTVIDGMYKNDYGLKTTEAIMFLDINDEQVVKDFEALSEKEKKEVIVTYVKVNWGSVIGVQHCYAIIRVFGKELLGADINFYTTVDTVQLVYPQNKSDTSINTPDSSPETQPVTPTQPGFGSIKGPLILIADNNDKTYLGKLTTNKFDSDSIFNEFGTYGSNFSIYSIWNEFGTYGSKFSIYSPFNQFSTTPPLMIDGNGNVLGRLSINSFVIGAISPYEIYIVLENLGF